MSLQQKQRICGICNSSNSGSSGISLQMRERVKGKEWKARERESVFSWGFWLHLTFISLCRLAHSLSLSISHSLCSFAQTAALFQKQQQDRHTCSANAGFILTHTHTLSCALSYTHGDSCRDLTHKLSLSLSAVISLWTSASLLLLSSFRFFPLLLSLFLSLSLAS